MTKVAFAWPGLPDYAARCIRAVIDRHSTQVSVVATRPSVPIEGMEKSLGQKVHWVEPGDTGCNWDEISDGPPDLLFVGIPKTPAFAVLADQCRADGGKVVMMSDQDWQGGLRQILIDPIRYRALIRPKFDGMFVPGILGERYATTMGFRTVERGVYGSDPTIFFAGPPLEDRPKTFLFVGQFIARKDVLGLTEAFRRFSDEIPGWTLRLCGSGGQREQIPEHPAIRIEDFVQPPQLGKMLRESRALILPSLEEHWGLVVHEAALSGCALLLSDRVAAGTDLASSRNSLTFPISDVDAMAAALKKMAQWQDTQWHDAFAASVSAADDFGPSAFADAVDRFARRLL